MANDTIPSGWDPNREWINSLASIDKDLVDEVAVTMVIKLVSMKVACEFLSIDSEVFRGLLNTKQKKYKALSTYASERIKSAESAREVKLIEDARSGVRNSQKLLEFLAPRQQKEYKEQMNMEITYFFHVIQDCVTPEQYKLIIQRLSDDHNAAEALDVAERIYYGVPNAH